MRIFTLKHPGSALGRNLLLLVVCTLLSLSAYAEANYVYHEATTNNPGCGADNYRSLLAPTSAQTLKLAWKVEFQLYTDQTRVYYTTDGSTPSGVKGVPSGTTKVLTGAYSCTFGSPVVDVATATIPAQPAGTVVKYIIGAWHSGGGDEIFANGPGAPCGGCGTVTNSAALATLFTYTVTASTGVVEVYATGGTAYTAYTTVKAAFDAINAGTHTGAIQIAINANTSETATAVLNSSGAGAATYTSIKMFPTGDAVTVSGASATGRGLIELNGADNVTIDGDNPNTAGTNRNLTITNTASATTTYTMAIRIAIATSVVTTANNVTIKNCVVNGSATGRNASANTSTTGSENNTYGIYAGGGASTVSQTTAPAAISSTTTTVGSGGTFNGLIIQNNAVNKCARGIAVQGSTTSVCDNLQVKDNLIGNSTAGSTDQVYSMGMTLQGFSAATVSNNTVYVESFLGTTALRGIDLGSVSSSGTAAVVELNKVYRVNTRNTGTYGAYGINIAAGANQVIRNNFVMGVTNDMSGGIAFSTAAGTFGIRISASTGHKVYHNSVSLTGLRSGTAASSLLSAAFAITTTSVTGCDVRNNIFSNTQSGGTTSLAYVSMYLPSGGTSAMALTLNNNAYYSGSTAGSTGICHVGTTYGTANLYTAANFVAGATTPATNLRAYTSTLGVSTSDNASYASTNAAPYTNATTDLHLDMASSELTNVEQKGVSGLGVGTDIDANVRPNSGTTLPDMGADEVAQAACSSADGGTISPTTATVCAGGTYAMASTGATVGTGITYQWKVSTTSGSGYVNVSGGTGATTTSYTTGALSAGTYYYVLETTCTAGPVSDLSNELVVTVNSVPTVTASSNSPVCSGSDLLLTGNVTGTATSYVWSGPNSFSATTQNATILSAGITHSGTYTFTASNGSCPSAPSTTVVTVNPAPTAIVLTPTSVTRCLNDAASKLKATSSVSSTYTSGVGTSTTVGNTTLATLGPNPLQMYYGGTKQQMIYTAAELTSFGLVAGSKINSIEFNLVTANTTYSLDSLTVKMKNSASASFPTASSWESGMTTVRPVAAYSPVVGWNNIALTTPFTWDGTSNLVIEVNYSNNNTGGSTTFNTAKYSATGFVSTIFYRVDSKTATAVDAFTGTANYTYSQRNDLKFNITTPAAITWSPSAGLFTNSGATTAYSGSAIDSVWAAPTATTKYYVTATLGSCTKTDSVTVTVNSPTAPAVADAQVCPGSTTTLDAGSYASYSWSNGATSQTITVGAGSYSVTVTDSNGCTATDAANVTEYSSVTAPAVADAQVCPGGTTTLNAGSYTSYSWSNGSTSQTNTVGAGSYSVTVTDSNGCTATDAANVTEYSVTAPAVADAQVCPGGTTTLNAGSYTSYSWSNGSTSQTNTVGVGSYSVTVTDSNGCTATDAASVSEYSVTAPAVADAQVCPGGTTTLNAGSYTSYSWSNGSTSQTNTVGVGSYSVTVTDSNGCTATDAASVTEYSVTAPAVADAQVCPGSTTTLNAGSYTSYSWSNGSTSQTITVGAGSYSVTVTDSNGCTATDAASVTEYSVTAPAVADAQVCPGGTTTLDAGSYASYSWSNGATSQTNTVGVGSYSVTVTDSNGCTATDAANVSEYSVTAPAVADAQVCPGGTTTLNAGSYTSYSWSNGSTSQTNTVGAGSYSVTVTDSNGCTATDAANVTEYSVTAPAVADAQVCPGGTTTLNAGSYTSYSWSNGSTSQTNTVGVGSYSVTVTDSNGCTATDAASVSEYSVTAPAVADAQVCPGGTTTLNAGSYTSYSWSNGSTSQTNTVGVGSYSVTVTDSNGCTATDAASVSEYSVTAPVVADAQACPGGTTTLNAGSYTSYSWSNASTSQTNTVGVGSYSVTVTDSNGCTATDAANVTEYSVTAPVVADEVVCAGATITLDAGSYTSYSWSNGATSQMNTVGAGSYSVTVTDSNGCTATDAVDVTAQSGASNIVLATGSTNGTPLTESCEEGDGWTYYADPSDPDRFIFGIQWGTTNGAARAAALVTIQLDPTYGSSTSASNGTWSMRRYWNVDIGGNTLVDPVAVRFFYDPAEVTAINTAAATFLAGLNPATHPYHAVEGFMWFKTVGTAFSPGGMTPDAITQGAIELINQNTGGATLNGVLYAEFAGITSFSGGTGANGVGTGSALPLTLVNFQAKAEGAVNQVYWTTASERNTALFVVERSVDGTNFQQMGTVRAAGNSNTPLNYQYTDNNPLNRSYYRLRMIDTDGSYTMSKVVLVERKKSAFNAVAMPVPTLNTVQITYEVLEKTPVEFSITDVLGRVVESRTVNPLLGMNTERFDMENQAVGIYFVNITQDSQATSVRIVKQ